MHNTIKLAAIRPARQVGVSLIEVLVSLIIIAIGVLGISKMQALAISNTQVSSARGLIALQAASIAATMHDNKAFWQVVPGATPPCNAAGLCSLTGTDPTKVSTAFGSTVDTAKHCATLCTTPQQIAAYEISTNMTNLNSFAPTYTLNIVCENTSGPTSCVINITWLEKQAGGNAATASVAATQGTVTQTYFLYVQP